MKCGEEESREEVISEERKAEGEGKRKEGRRGTEEKRKKFSQLFIESVCSSESSWKAHHSLRR